MVQQRCSHYIAEAEGQYTALVRGLVEAHPLPSLFLAMAFDLDGGGVGLLCS